MTSSGCWSLLPNDILINILGRLDSLNDSFAVRCVCRDWRKVTTEPSNSLYVILLLLSSNNSETLCGFTSRRTYSLPFQFDAPHTIAFSHGHLITTTIRRRHCLIHFRDLYTGTKTVLTAPFVFNRIFLSDRPDSTRCQLVALPRNCYPDLWYRNIGDNRWTCAHSPWANSVCDMMYFRGEWLALNWNMVLLAVELMGNKLTVRELGGAVDVTGRKKTKNLWLGEFDGVLFAVRRNSVSDYDVFQWDAEKKEWEETRDVGDKALFVSPHGRLVLIPATRSGVRKNCAYWPNNIAGSWDEFSLEDRSCIEGNVDCQGLLLLRERICTPVWVFPSNR